MSLVLTIVKQPAGQQVTETRKLFGESGGTLGRAGSCSWHLPDPSRFVSSQHASIRYANGEYYLVDTSTNGVYVNDNPQPLGTGNEVRLSQGDRLYIGEYEVQVAFEQSVAQDMGNDDFDRWLDPQSTAEDVPGEATGSIADLLAAPGSELDPLAALDRVSGDGVPKQTAASDADWLMGQSDNAPAASHAFVPPEAIPEASAPPPSAGAGNGVIPDDWDIDDLLAGEPAPAPSPVAATPPPAPPKPAQQHPLMASADPAYGTPPSANADHAQSGDPLAALDASDDKHLDYIVPPDEGEAKIQQEASELDAFLGLSDGAAGVDSDAEAPVAPSVTSQPLTAEPAAPTPKPQTESPPETSAQPADKLAAPSTDPIAPEPPVTEPPQSAVPAQPMTPVSPPAAAPAAGELADQLIRSLGLEPSMVNAKQREAFDQIVVDMLRESLKGMMQVLGARQAIKNEFRMSVTLIQAAENNPLKFSPNVDEALRNMFASHTNAYLPGVLAIRDGFNDIADHQVAVVAGMRAAFRSLLKRFDPAELQLRFDKLQSKSALLSGKKARYWESYTEFYADLANNMDEAFQDLFGEDFAEAYEQQMSRLEAARKS